MRKWMPLTLAFTHLTVLTLLADTDLSFVILIPYAAFGMVSFLISAICAENGLGEVSKRVDEQEVTVQRHDQLVQAHDLLVRENRRLLAALTQHLGTFRPGGQPQAPERKRGLRAV